MRWSWWNTIALITPFLLDRLTKAWALAALDHNTIVVNQYLTFDLMFNRGVSWGIFNGSETWKFVFVNCMIGGAVLLVGWFVYQFMKQGRMLFPLLFIFSGALSNIVDRVIYHGVIDFIVFHYHDWFWPTFNVADVFIEVGAVCLIIQGLYSSWD